MYRLFLKAFGVLIMLLNSNGSSFAAISECDPVLLQRTLNWSAMSRKSQLSWLKLVNEKNYKQVQDDVGASVPGIFSGTYKSFEDQRNELFAKESFGESEDEARQNLRIDLPTGATSAWVDCIKLRSAGLFAYISEADRDQATITIDWNPPVGMEGSTLKASAKLSNVAMPNDLSKPFAIRHGGAGYLLKRQKITEPMRVVINATTQNDKGSYHVELFVPPVFPIPARPCVETNMDGQCVRCSWDKFEVRGGPNSEGTLVCPNMASASDVILAMDATSLLQEDWDGPAPGDPWFAHYILTGPTKTYNQIGAIVHGGCSEVLNFGEKTFLLGEVKAGSAAAATFKTAQCQGCSSAGNAYSCVARYTGLKMFIK